MAITDKLTTIKNYCFVNFDSITEANKAIISLNGKKVIYK